MPKSLRVKENGNYLKVVDPYYETVCESFLDHAGYTPKAKVTLNEMTHAWNTLFLKGQTSLPEPAMIVTKKPTKTFLVEGKEYASLELVEAYAKEKGKRVLLTQTSIGSNIYLVTLTI